MMSEVKIVNNKNSNLSRLAIIIIIIIINQLLLIIIRGLWVKEQSSFCYVRVPPVV